MGDRATPIINSPPLRALSRKASKYYHDEEKETSLLE